MAGKKQLQEQPQEETTLTLEEHFARLEETIGRLEEDISLEDAFAAYSEGMKLLKSCNEQIDRVEKKVLKLAEDGGLEELES
ncbi:MAG: exodeoxyribonuclease VII small subunit [Acetatifactor sp.]|nr:exodeoxyribonuclease VII small subunit [Acetatifactor sp.]